MAFCPNCGSTKDLYKGFCIPCYKKMHEFVKIPEKIKISKCRRCGYWFFKNKWIEDSYKSLEKIIENSLKTELYNKRIELDLKGKKALLKITGFADPQKIISIEEKKELELKFDEKTCDKCLKFSNKYFEVKIQLRRKPVFDLMKYAKIKKLIEREVGRIPEGKAFWAEEVKGGIDFFFGFKQTGDNLFEKILEKFKPEHETSYEFRGLTKEGKKKVRTTYCIRV